MKQLTFHYLLANNRSSWFRLSIGLLVFCVALFWFSGNRLWAQTPTPEPTPSTPATAEASPLDNTVNILVLGDDRREDELSWRTDAIMIVALDLEEGRAGVISLPRDIYVDGVPNVQPHKINTFDYTGEQIEEGGGPKLLARIIKDKMDLPIHHYVRLELDGFQTLIDALGGLEISLTEDDFIHLPARGVTETDESGVYHLSGWAALTYVRSRQPDSDLQRNRRQQRVLAALRDQLEKENLFLRLPALYAAMYDKFETDIDVVEAMRYADFVLGLDETTVHCALLSSPDMLQVGWRDRMWVFLADWEQIAEYVQTIFDRPALAAGGCG